MSDYKEFTVDLDSIKTLVKSNVTYSVAHDAASADEIWDYSARYIGQIHSAWYPDPTQWHIYRQVFNIDTTDLAGLSIESAQLILSGSTPHPDLVVHLVEPAFSDPVVVSDYGVLGTKVISYGSVFWPAASTGAVLPLNAAGLGLLNVGVSKFALRSVQDINDSAVEDHIAGGPQTVGVSLRVYYGTVVRSGSGPSSKDIVSLEAIRNVEMSAMGRAYVDEEGNFIYESRYTRNG